MLVVGDVYETAAPPPEATAVVYDALLALRETGAQVVVVGGNHDQQSQLDAVAPVFAATRHHRARASGRTRTGGRRRRRRPRCDDAVGLAALGDQDRTADGRDGRGHRAVLRGARRAPARVAERGLLAADTVNIVAAHCMVQGGMLGGGERDAQLIDEYTVPTAAFPAAANYVALGHLHRAQQMPGAAPIWYSGSPIQVDFGEESDTKQVLLVDIPDRGAAKVSPVALTRGAVLRTLRGTFAELEKLAAPTSATPSCASFVREQPRAGLADDVRALLPTAVDVRVAPDVPADDRDAACARAVERADDARAICSASTSTRPGTPTTTGWSRCSTSCSTRRPSDAAARRSSSKGFAAFRERTTVDFRDAELFAIVGATGHGKSSLIDAICFALYGKVPRHGEHDIAPVMTLGCNETRVSFTFELGGAPLHRDPASLRRKRRRRRRHHARPAPRATSTTTAPPMCSPANGGRIRRGDSPARRPRLRAVHQVRRAPPGPVRVVPARPRRRPRRDPERAARSRPLRPHGHGRTRARRSARRGPRGARHRAGPARRSDALRPATRSRRVPGRLTGSCAPSSMPPRRATLALAAEIAEPAGAERDAAASPVPRSLLCAFPTISATVVAADRRRARAADERAAVEADAAEARAIDAEAARDQPAAARELRAAAEAHTDARPSPRRIEKGEDGPRASLVDAAAAPRTHWSRAQSRRSTGAGRARRRATPARPRATRAASLHVGEPCPVCDQAVDKLPPRSAPPSSTQARKAHRPRPRRRSPTCNRPRRPRSARSRRARRCSTTLRERHRRVRRASRPRTPTRRARGTDRDRRRRSTRSPPSARPRPTDPAQEPRRPPSRSSRPSTRALDAGRRGVPDASATRSSAAGLDPPRPSRGALAEQWDALEPGRTTIRPDYEKRARRSSTTSRPREDRRARGGVRRPRTPGLDARRDRADRPLGRGLTLAVAGRATRGRPRRCARSRASCTGPTSSTRPWPRHGTKSCWRAELGRLLDKGHFGQWLVDEALRGPRRRARRTLLDRLSGGQYALTTNDRRRAARRRPRQRRRDPLCAQPLAAARRSRHRSPSPSPSPTASPTSRPTARRPSSRSSSTKGSAPSIPRRSTSSRARSSRSEAANASSGSSRTCPRSPNACRCASVSARSAARPTVTREDA